MEMECNCCASSVNDQYLLNKEIALDIEVCLKLNSFISRRVLPSRRVDGSREWLVINV